MRTHYDVIVIGGGAAGMMAAGRAAERGRRVLLLEKNDALGEKLKITGGGRCNITNAQPSLQAFLRHFGVAEQFLYSSFSQFGIEDTFTFFEKLNLPLVIQARQRVFPVTEKAGDVVVALEKYMKAGKVDVRRGIAVTDVQSEQKKITAVSCGKHLFSADSFILATGGKSHPETGSTGDGFLWLKKIGHRVQEPTPTIVPLAVEELWIKRLAGVAFPNAKITFFVNQKKSFKIQGKILCTHFGVSGPLILNSASKVAELLHQGMVTATVDIFPDLDLGALDQKIIKLFDEHKNKNFETVFKFLVPAGTTPALVGLLKTISPEIKVHSITKAQRKEIVTVLKNLPLTIEGLMGYDRAVIADGGVSIKEIDAKTMRSKLVDNLFVTGDLLHINRPSGGYSLQLCWTSGYVAGTHA